MTAKSGDATKRLQARTDSSSSSGGVSLNIDPSSDLAPEFAIQTNDTLCKRLLVPPSGGGPVTIESGSFANCGLSLGSESVPACRDAKDNDGDGKVDMADPGCSDANDTDEYNDPGCQSNCGGGDNTPAPTGANGPSTPPVCTITNLEKRFGNCTNSHIGGEWIEVPPGSDCWVLQDFNYAGLGRSAPVCAAGQNPTNTPAPGCPPERPLYDTANGCQAVGVNPDYPLCEAGWQRIVQGGPCEKIQDTQITKTCEAAGLIGNWGNNGDGCYPRPPSGGGYGYCGFNNNLSRFALVFKPYFAFWVEAGCGGGYEEPDPPANNGGGGNSGGGSDSGGSVNIDDLLTDPCSYLPCSP